MGVVVIPLPPSWRSRLLRERPQIVISTPYTSTALDVAKPLPKFYQSALPVDLQAHLPQVVGRFPFGGDLVRYAQALALGQGVEAPGLLASPPAPIAPPVLAVVNRAQHTTYSVFARMNQDTVLLPRNPWRTYLLVVNLSTTNDATIAYDTAATPKSLPLVAGGGFHELTLGTVSGLRGQGLGADVELSITEGVAYPHGAVPQQFL